jgi:alkylhydroperoxidase family enzyme
MARLPYPEREDMQAELAELLGGFPRYNITEMYAHAATLTLPLLRMMKAQYNAVTLSDRQRELIVLTVAGSVDSEYEYHQHVPISEAVGIDADLRDRVYGGDVGAPDDPAERALLVFVAAVIASPHVRDEIFEPVRRNFTPRQIIETLQLIGSYWCVGRISTVLEIEADHPTGLEAVNAVSSVSG